LEAAKRKLDQAEGRDTLTADRLMGRIDSLLAVVQSRLSKFESESLRRRGYVSTNDAYRRARNAFVAYPRGDVGQIPVCIENCKLFGEELEKYRKFYEELSPIPTFIESAAEPVWDDFHAAGYDDSHDAVQRARQLWESENEYAHAVEYTEQVKSLLAQLDELNVPGGGANSVPDMLQKAEQDLANPSPELLERIGGFVVDKLQSLKSQASKFESIAYQCKALKESKQKAFESAYSTAKQNWKDYEAAIVHLHLTEKQYASAPTNCVRNCSTAEAVIADMEKEYNSRYVRHVESSEQLKSDATEYLKTIPIKDNSVESARQKYQEASRLRIEILKYCNLLNVEAAAFKRVYEETLPKRVESEVAPLKQKAQEAIDYIQKNHKPLLIPEVVVVPFSKDIVKRASDASTAGATVNRLSRTTQADYESFMTARNRMNSYWQKYQTLGKQKASSASLRMALQNCIAQADKMIELAPKITSGCLQAKNAIADLMSSYADAKYEFDYIEQNRQVDPSAYTSAKRAYNDLSNRVSLATSVQPAFNTRYLDVSKYVKDAEEMKKSCTNANRTIGSVVIR